MENHEAGFYPTGILFCTRRTWHLEFLTYQFLLVDLHLVSPKASPTLEKLYFYEEEMSVTLPR